MMGGAFYDDEGRLRLVGNITKEDYTNLFSARKDRLVYETDPETGIDYVYDLSELPLVEKGQERPCSVLVQAQRLRPRRFVGACRVKYDTKYLS
jgi:hypothetical protein